MAGAIDLFSGSNAITGRNLFQVDKNPLNVLDMGVQDVIGQQAVQAGNKIISSLEALGASIMGITVQELSALGTNVGNALGTFFGNILAFLGNFNPLDVLFNVEAAAEKFLSEVLMVAAPFVALIKDVETAAQNALRGLENWLVLLGQTAWNDITGFVNHILGLTPIQNILDAFGWVSTGINNALTDLNSALHNIPGFNVILKDISGIAHNLTGFLTNLTPAGIFTDLTKIVDNAGNQLHNFLANLTPTGVFTDFTKIQNTLNQDLHSFLTNLSPTGVFTDFTQIKNTLNQDLHSFLQNLDSGGIFTDITKIKDNANNLLSNYIQHLDPVAGTFPASQLIGAISSAVVTLWTQITDGAGHTLDQFLHNISPTGIFTDFTKIQNLASQALSGFLTNLGSGGVFTDLTKIVDSSGNQLHNYLLNLHPVTGVFTDITKIVDTFNNPLSGYLANLGATGAMSLAGLPNISIGGTATDIQSTIQNFVDNIAAGVGQSAGQAIANVTTMLRSIPSFNVAGVWGGTNIDSHQNTLDAIFNGLMGFVTGGGTGHGVQDVQNAAFSMFQTMNTSSSGLTTTIFSAAGTYTYTVPAGTAHVDIIVLGGGGGGAGGSVINHGNGAAAGIFGQVATLARASVASTFTVVVGAGGAGGPTSGGSGSGGNQSTVTYNTGLTVSGAGGAPGVGVAGSFVGASPGSDTVNSIAYQGGAAQTSSGFNGNSSGGGGAGGNIGFSLGPGGAGAAGCVWIRAY